MDRLCNSENTFVLCVTAKMTTCPRDLQENCQCPAVLKVYLIKAAQASELDMDTSQDSGFMSIDVSSQVASYSQHFASKLVNIKTS